DPHDSIDVVGTAAAAHIDPAQPGRAVVSRGRGDELVQMARVTGRTAPLPRTPTITPLGPWRVPTRPAGNGPSAPTDLTALVDAVGAATQHTGRSPTPAPWLPPLPEHLAVGELPRPPRSDLVHLGLRDCPARQRQRPVAFDLGRG